MRRYTHLARTLSLAYPAHRGLFVLLVLAAVGGWIDPGRQGVAVAMFRAVLTVALTWMLVQELEPDRAWVALAGAATAGATALLTGEADLAALAVLMLASRILVRSTGLIPRLTDILVVGLFAGIFARSPLAWAAGLAMASAIALDTNHSQPAPARYTWLALAIGVAVTITAVFSGAVDLTWTTPGLVTAALAVAGIALLLTGSPQPSSLDDGMQDYDPARVRATRLLATLAVALGALAGGGVHAAGTWPAWIALVTAGVGAHVRRWTD